MNKCESLHLVRFNKFIYEIASVLQKAFVFSPISVGDQPFYGALQLLSHGSSRKIWNTRFLRDTYTIIFYRHS